MAESTILHFTGVRLRVLGSGNLQLSLISLSDVNTNTLTPLAMNAATNIEPLVLSNLLEQRAYLKGMTVNKNEVFNISRIIIYIKPTYTSYPQ